MYVHTDVCTCRCLHRYTDISPDRLVQERARKENHKRGALVKNVLFDPGDEFGDGSVSIAQRHIHFTQKLQPLLAPIQVIRVNRDGLCVCVETYTRI